MSNTTCGLRGCLPGRCGTATTDSSGHASGSRLGPAKWLADTDIRRAFCLLVQWTRRLARPLRWLFLSGRTVGDEARNSGALARRPDWPIRLRKIDVCGQALP